MHVFHGFFYLEMNPNNFKKEKKIEWIFYLFNLMQVTKLINNYI